MFFYLADNEMDSSLEDLLAANWLPADYHLSTPSSPGITPGRILSPLPSISSTTSSSTSEGNVSKYQQL